MLASGNPTALSGLFIGGGGGKSIEVANPAGGDPISINGVSGLIKAIASNSNTNVLATPQILALDNTEAEFEVGETVQIQNQVTNANGTTANSNQQQEAKLSLKITPQINKVTRFVKLQINQTINDFIGTVADAGNNGLPTTIRSAVTEVIVRDKDTIAMGGLLRDKESVSYSKVPLLGDIPVLGWLFKSKSTKIDKTNLLMFLTPTILSPYEGNASKRTLKTLSDRMDNLQNIIDDDHEAPFKKQVEKLTQKVEKQTRGPLYDTTPNTYQKINNSEGIGPKERVNYQEILKNIKRK